MTNVKNHELRKCIIKASDDFDRDVDRAFGKKMEVAFHIDGLMVTDTVSGKDISLDELNKALSEYYGCTVTSVHMDDCDVVGVWICYR